MSAEYYATWKEQYEEEKKNKRLAKEKEMKERLKRGEDIKIEITRILHQGELAQLKFGNLSFSIEYMTEHADTLSVGASDAASKYGCYYDVLIHDTKDELDPLNRRGIRQEFPANNMLNLGGAYARESDAEEALVKLRAIIEKLRDRLGEHHGLKPLDGTPFVTKLTETI
jgi:hypothetical protein